MQPGNSGRGVLERMFSKFVQGVIHSVLIRGRSRCANYAAVHSILKNRIQVLASLKPPLNRKRSLCSQAIQTVVLGA